MAIYTEPYLLRLPVEVKGWLSKEAADRERSLNWLICRLLKRAMEQHQSGKLRLEADLLVVSGARAEEE